MKQALSSVALQEIIPAILPSSELHVSALATKRRRVPKYTCCFDFIHTLVSSVSEGNVLSFVIDPPITPLPNGQVKACHFLLSCFFSFRLLSYCEILGLA